MGREYPVGTRRQWQGVWHVKGGDGKWCADPKGKRHDGEGPHAGDVPKSLVPHMAKLAAAGVTGSAANLVEARELINTAWRKVQGELKGVLPMLPTTKRRGQAVYSAVTALYAHDRTAHPEVYQGSSPIVVGARVRKRLGLEKAMKAGTEFEELCKSVGVDPMPGPDADEETPVARVPPEVASPADVPEEPLRKSFDERCAASIEAGDMTTTWQMGSMGTVGGALVAKHE